MARHGRASQGASWPRRLWFSGGELVAWGWAQLPRRVRRSDGSEKDITGAYLAYQVHPDHAGLILRTRPGRGRLAAASGPSSG